VVLLIADRAGKAIAENQVANQIAKAGAGVQPSVSIAGFPFLTQLAARDFQRVDISASNVPAGPLKIASIAATATGVHVNSSYNGATVDHVTGTGTVTFDAIGNALSGNGSGGSGGSSGGSGGPGIVSLSKAGPHEIKVDVGPVSETATVQQTGTSRFTVQIANTGDPLSGLLNSLGGFSFTVPKLPVGMQVTGFQVTAQGLVITFGASHTSLTQ
jgi:hypothetical protein